MGFAKGPRAGHESVLWNVPRVFREKTFIQVKTAEAKNKNGSVFTSAQFNPKL